MTFVSLETPCSIIVAVVRKFVLLIPLIYIMPQLMSDPGGVFMAEPVADVIAVTFTAILFLSPVPQIHDGAGAGGQKLRTLEQIVKTFQTNDFERKIV